MSNPHNAPWGICSHSWSDTSIIDNQGNMVCTNSIEYYATEETQDELEAKEVKKFTLIAAAPDMLGALEPFANYACDDWHTHGCHNCIAKRAIAKAKGGLES